MEKILYIHEQFFTEHPVLMGYLYVYNNKGKEVYSFEFDNDWLKNHNNVLIDPELAYWAGRQYLNSNKPIFGFLSDMCPDRWGRFLMERKEAEVASLNNLVPKKLTEVDYLMRVNDSARMGAVRISREPYGKFISDDKISSIKSIRQLESIARDITDPKREIDICSLSQLFSPGSSLGGARPKASIVDADGQLWVAKFPSKNDGFNREAWEMVCHDLMRDCKINVVDAKIENYSKYGSTFLAKRFDRDKNKRIHFSSAMNLLGKHDNDADVGYLDIVSFIRSSGSHPNKDLLELYKRLAFNMLVRNTDGHLRNHGFLMNKHGWRLSPAYDVNPTPYGDQLSLCVTENSRLINYQSAVKVAGYYGIEKNQAIDIFKTQRNIIMENWQSYALKYGLTNRQINDMQPAFTLCYNLY